MPGAAAVTDRGRVLVADDSATVRAVARSELEAQGILVEEAVDGEDALARLRADPPDALLLDIEMPRLDGFGVLAAIAGEPEIADVPVIMVTRRSDRDDLVRGLRMGAMDYVSKPFDEVELVARVRVALRQRRLLEQLKAQNAELAVVARRDALTGLSNRRALDEALQVAAAEGARRSFETAVLLADIDRFKAINDTAGHAVGDAVLVAVGTAMAAAVRAADTVGRWGGEEFLVVLPRTPAEQGLAMAERLRAAVAALRPPAGVAAVTVSLGVASLAPGVDPEAAVRLADQRLYLAKAAGRNCVVGEG